MLYLTLLTIFRMETKLYQDIPDVYIIESDDKPMLQYKNYTVGFEKIRDEIFRAYMAIKRDYPEMVGSLNLHDFCLERQEEIKDLIQITYESQV